MNKPLKVLLIVFLLTDATVFPANAGNDKPSSFFKGWEHSVKGGGFVYHSPDPEVQNSLLLRSVDSSRYIEWETEKIPPAFASANVSFVWMFGIDANPDSHTYKLFVNGNYCLEFSNPAVSEKKDWTVHGSKGSSLTFRTTMLDKYDDPMGYTFLTLPSAFIKKGEKQVIKVVGESAGSNTWYMTFESSVEEKISLVQQQTILRGPGKEGSYCESVTVVHLGDPVKVSIQQSIGRAKQVTVEPGYNSFLLQFPVTEGLQKDLVKITLEGKALVEKEITLMPVKPWKIYFVQHAHTDIGYTRPQTEILPEHLRYIDFALDYCDQTDSLPDDARFRWTCETSWAVNEYLRTRPPAQLERLKRRAAEGRIELTALYLNSSDLGDEPTIASSLKPAAWFRSQGFKIKTAMQDDINGVPWCLADYLSGESVSFLNMGQNTDRALKPFDRPTTFLWESPSGKRIIVNRPEHYMWGNNMGIISSIEALEKSLLPHLSEIDRKGYPFNEYAIQFSGYFTDNSPPSTIACRIVKEWNETYLWPQLRLSTISEFLEEVRAKHEKDLPVVHGAWPDWWIDGFGSAALTTAYTRMAHADLIANNGLMSIAAILGEETGPHVTDLHNQITEDLAFYDEHTFGAAESISDPLCENSVVQLGEKLSYTWEAVKKNRILREEVMGRVQGHLPSYKKQASIAVINTLNYDRDGYVNLYIDHQLLPGDRQFNILDQDNKEIPAQTWNERAEGSYFTLFATKIPSLGYRSYRIVLTPEPVKQAAANKFSGSVENEWYVLKIDTINGKITSLYDKQAGRELVKTGAEYGFGEFIYETLGNNREQISNRHLDECHRRTWEKVKVSAVTEGAVWTTLTLKGQLPGCADGRGISCEIRLYKHSKQVEFLYSMVKLAVTDPEGVYISFPFNMKKDNRILFEVAGAAVEAGKDQINGSATDWQGIQNYISLSDDSCGVVFVSPEIPVVQLGHLNIGRFQPVVNKPEPVIYSWVLNNYWTTNFLASQEGELKWTYIITSAPAIGRDEAANFAWGSRVPMLARVLPAGKDNGRPASAAFMGNTPSNLLLVNVSPEEGRDAVVFNIRETAGKPVSFDPLTMLENLAAHTSADKNKIRAYLLDAPGEVIKPIEGILRIAPFETVFIKLAWNEQ